MYAKEGMTMKQRPNNPGSVYELPDRKCPYIAQVSDHGKRFTRSFQTEAERSAWIRQIQSNANPTKADISDAGWAYAMRIMRRFSEKTHID